MSISLFSPIYPNNNSNIRDNCSFLRFTTDFFTFGQKAYQIEIHNADQTILGVIGNEEEKLTWRGIVARIVLIFSVVLPIILFFGRLIYRRANKFQEVSSLEKREDLSRFLEGDKKLISGVGELSNNTWGSIIGGYLNLDSKDGWPDGYDNRAGAAFARFVLVNYFVFIDSGEPILEKVINAFTDIGKFGDLWNSKEGHRPKMNKACYDQAIFGWQNHAVCRMVGNLGSTYDPFKPFFEILVNSARKSMVNPLCKPFFISIHNNEKELDARRILLASSNSVQPAIAHQRYYAPNLKKPEECLEEHKDRLGPNSKRLLEGLTFLQNMTISAQKANNCWMKQTMRCLLVSLYLELFTNRQTLSPETAWDAAKTIYKHMQKTVAIPYIEHCLSKTKATPQMMEKAWQAIETQKSITK